MGALLQNWRVLGLMTAETGGTCIVSGEEYCFYVSEYELVKQIIQMFKELQQNHKTPTCPHPDHWSPILPGILPYPIAKMKDT